MAPKPKKEQDKANLGKIKSSYFPKKNRSNFPARHSAEHLVPERPNKSGGRLLFPFLPPMNNSEAPTL